MSEIAVTVLAACLTTIAVVMAVAFSHKKLSATIDGQVGQLRGTISIVSNGLAAKAGGSGPSNGPLVWLPLWKQSGGVLPDGALDPQQWNDCGETCCAMVIAGIRGVCLEPGDIRQQLGGTQRSGLTTGEDLARALMASAVPAHVEYLGASPAWDRLGVCYGLAKPVIALGHWLSSSSLHWILLDDKSPGSFTFIDPWTGLERTVNQAQWNVQYAGTLVLVDDVCHYNQRLTPTPGTGSQS